MKKKVKKNASRTGIQEAGETPQASGMFLFKYTSLRENFNRGQS